MSSKRKTVFILLCILSLLWMATIFGFSADNAQESTVQSRGVVELILKTFVPDFEDMPEDVQQMIIEKFDKPVRKTAHFVSYALLGLLLYLCAGSVKWLPERLAAPSAISVPMCIAFALSDEYHQTFVSGRAGRFSDVLIDSSGVICGTLFAAMVVLMFRKYKLSKKDV